MGWSLFWHISFQPAALAGSLPAGRCARAAPSQGRRPGLQCFPWSASKAGQGKSHFRLMVVFTPWPVVVLSSNQRSVMVLVCV